MKHLLSIIFILIFSLASGQSTPAIKIYLEDAETGKNICDAKVTLEGFEIPAITGKYDKKGKYYYFKEIPKGYNTIMSYHKKYNEKGFQEVKSLPVELKLNLKKRENNFLILPEDFYSDEKKALIKKYDYREYYIEDQFKIVIDTDVEMSYELKRQYLIDLITEKNLGVELVNPFFEKDKMSYNVDYNIYNDYLKGQNEGYPNKLEYDSNGLMQSYQILPLYSGISTMDDFFKFKDSKEICFIFRKSNGTKFKRFNDPIIDKIKKLKLNVCTIILYKRSERVSSDLFKKNAIRDKLNNMFNKKNAVDSSKIFIYDNRIRNKTIYKLREESKNLRNLIYEPGNEQKSIPNFILLKTDNLYISNSYLFEMNSDNFYYPKEFATDFYYYKLKLLIPIQENSIGLGLLDQYEYYANKQQ